MNTDIEIAQAAGRQWAAEHPLSDQQCLTLWSLLAEADMEAAG